MSERKTISKATRQKVYEKYNGHCAYCGIPIHIQEMQVDHCNPIRLGGADDISNMMPACRNCNHYKRGNSLEGWRKMIENITETLKRDNYTYRQALRFGMVSPNPHEIKFYYEKNESEVVKMKASLTIDMPKNCYDCQLRDSLMYCLAVNEEYDKTCEVNVNKSRPAWCPLIPIETLPDMRDATSEERQAVNEYIGSISHDTGVDFHKESEVE